MSWIMLVFALIGLWAFYNWGSEKWGKPFEYTYLVFAVILFVYAFWGM